MIDSCITRPPRKMLFMSSKWPEDKRYEMAAAQYITQLFWIEGLGPMIINLSQNSNQDEKNRRGEAIRIALARQPRRHGSPLHRAQP